MIVYESPKQRIAFRRIGTVDLYKLQELLNDSWRSRHHWRLVNDDDQLSWLKSIHRDPSQYCLIAEDLDSGEAVGIYRLTHANQQVYSGVSNIDIFAEYRGKGYGTRVLSAGIEFAWGMGFEWLQSEILSTNIASKNLHSKLGFLYCGSRRNAVQLNGSFVNSGVYQLRRS